MGLFDFFNLSSLSIIDRILSDAMDRRLSDALECILSDTVDTRRIVDGDFPRTQEKKERKRNSPPRRARSIQNTAQKKRQQERKAPPKRADSIRYGSFIDSRDGTQYKTVKIGNQIWLAENLKYKCRDSYSYKDNKSNDENYGRLYMYCALAKACPEGWHIPSDAEWEELANYVKEHKDSNGTGTSLKADHFCRECCDDVPLGTNQFGFSARAAGYRNSLTFYHNQGFGAYFWSDSEDPEYSGKANVWYLKHDEEVLSSEFESKLWAVSVRCIKD